MALLVDEYKDQMVSLDSEIEKLYATNSKNFETGQLKEIEKEMKEHLAKFNQSLINKKKTKFRKDLQAFNNRASGHRQANCIEKQDEAETILEIAQPAMLQTIPQQNQSPPLIQPVQEPTRITNFHNGGGELEEEGERHQLIDPTIILTLRKVHKHNRGQNLGTLYQAKEWTWETLHATMKIL